MGCPGFEIWRKASQIRVQSLSEQGPLKDLYVKLHADDERIMVVSRNRGTRI